MQKKGFTLLELLSVIAIFLAIMAVAFPNLFGSSSKKNLDGATQQIVSLLREAQSNAMSQERGTAWSVYFSNATNTSPFYALITSSTYSASATVGYYLLPPIISYVTSTLASGATRTVTFSQITGLASVSTSIGLFLPNRSTLSSTIFVASSGAVSF